MTIAFNNVPDSARASKVFIEMAGEKKSLASLFIPPCGMLIGQYDPLKTATVNYVPIKVTSKDDVGNKFGFGSHIHRQALRFPDSVFLQGNGIYAAPIPEAGAGTTADMDITFTGNAGSSGTWYFQIGGDLVYFGVVSGDTPTTQAAALAAAITAKRNIAVTALATLGVCAIDAKFKGTAGNQIEVIVNPAGAVQEEQNPSTTTVALGEVSGFLAGGATDPSVEDLFFDVNGADILGDRWYTAMTMPFTDQTNIDFHKTSAILRKDPSVNRFFASYGGYIKEAYSAALALPASTNSEFIGEIWEDRVQCPAFELSARLVGLILDSQNQAPNQPYKTLDTELPVDADGLNRTWGQNDALFRAGMGACFLDTAGNLRLGDIALTRRTTDLGGDTEEWLDAVSLHTRQAKAYSLEQLFLTEKYSRAVVVDNAAVTKVSYAIAPKDVIADIKKLVEDLWLPYGWSKNGKDIIASITAEINSTFEGRIDSQLTDDEAKALRIIAVKYAYLY